MARAIDKDDSYVDRMLKHVPTEIIGAYLAVGGVLSTVPPAMLAITQWVNFAVFLAVTPFWMIYVAHVPSAWQNVLSATAFVVWVMTVPGGPFTSLVPGAIASACVILFSAVLAPLVSSIFSKQTPSPSPVRG